MTKISKRLAKRNLAIPNMHDERRQPIKKKKKKKERRTKERKSDNWEEDFPRHSRRGREKFSNGPS